MHISEISEIHSLKFNKHNVIDKEEAVNQKELFDDHNNFGELDCRGETINEKQSQKTLQESVVLPL